MIVVDKKENGHACLKWNQKGLSPGWAFHTRL